MAAFAVAYFQPIYSISQGRVVGFETLARLDIEGRVLPPAQFLPALDIEASLRLLLTLLKQGIAFLHALEPEPDLYLTINVSPSVLLHPELVEMVRFTLAASECSPDRLLIEIIEDEAIADPKATARAINELKALGIAIALDDVGSGYSSLVHIKELSVDVLKLDQSFSRQLANRPEDLQFVSSMLGLATGLGRKLIVEGVETADILEALTIIGVDYVQGYTIARPMPASAATKWLKTASLQPPSREPTSMLGVYAAHLTIVETCRVLANQPFKLRWHEEAADPHLCTIGKYLDRHCLHDTSYGRAHLRFHQSLAGDAGAWYAAAEDLRRSLLEALHQEPRTATGDELRAGVV